MSVFAFPEWGDPASSTGWMITFAAPIVAVAFAGLCVWLAVRIINRRERWAKWMLAATLSLPVLYVLSFGPACWALDWQWLSPEFVARAFYPILKWSSDAPDGVRAAIWWWATLTNPDSHVGITLGYTMSDL